MHPKELLSFNIKDSVDFHEDLNPKLFENNKLIPEVRERLLLIAKDFIQYLGLTSGLDVADITLSGSNAAYSYTKYSDIDLHLVVDYDKFNNDEVYRELFDSKKNQYNTHYDIKIGGYEVELYVQDEDQPHFTLGEYSVLHNKWISFPKRRRANYDEKSTYIKYKKLENIILASLKSDDYNAVTSVMHKLKNYRKSGLEQHGEFGPENISFKMARNNQLIEKLYRKINELHSKELSLDMSSPKLHEQITAMVSESSGYVPSEKEKNDPRWKTALTVDITPTSIQDNAKKLGSTIDRDGRPPYIRSNNATAKYNKGHHMTTTSGSIASVPNGKNKSGSIFSGIKTSKKYANSLNESSTEFQIVNTKTDEVEGTYKFEPAAIKALEKMDNKKQFRIEKTVKKEE